MNPGQPLRIATIDILRAFTMLLMIFVNDLWSLQNVPKWLEHTAAKEDGMGLADIVFPAFLVIVGMSVPFSISNRHNKGESTSSIIVHILLRSFALLVMGLFLVNGENISETGTGMPRSLWNSLCCLAFIFIWNSYPPNTNKTLLYFLKSIGWAILFLLAWIYRGGDQSNLLFGTLWWGILGLIGWAYLISALVYASFRSNLPLISGFFVLCISINMLAHANIIPSGSLLRTLIAPFGEGAMPAFVTAGMITSVFFIKMRQSTPTRLIGLLLLIGGVLVAAGFLVRPYWGISKIMATPSWVLICSGTTIAFFSLVYWFADVKGKSGVFNIIKPGGTNTLLCYLLPYFAYAIIYGLLKTQYPEVISTGVIGLAKSFLFALIIIQLAGLAGKAGVKLKL
jgi:heparan-alpha-glucosaminide N-acetyltransferase